MKNTIRFEARGVKVVAHRGLSGIERENTNAAFVAAGNRSYFGIETDVHVTADGRYVCFHDDNTERIGLDRLEIEKSTYQTLRELLLTDLDGARGRTDLRIASMVEYVRICRKYGKVCVLELKNHFEPEQLDEIIDIIRGENWLDQVIFISFDWPNMLAIREKLPAQRAQFLTSRWSDELVDQLVRSKLDLDIYFKALTEPRVRELKAAGITVNCWTVDDPETAEQLAKWGVDQITTNILE